MKCPGGVEEQENLYQRCGETAPIASGSNNCNVTVTISGLECTPQSG